MQREQMLRTHGELIVTITSSDSFSSVKRESSFADYVAEHVDREVPADQRARDSWYLFGDTYGVAQWDALAELYTPQPLDAATDNGLVTIGFGGRHSGVSFHTHGAAFAESVIGAKRWFLSPPDLRPTFDATLTQLNWTIAWEARMQRRERRLNRWRASVARSIAAQDGGAWTSPAYNVADDQEAEIEPDDSQNNDDAILQCTLVAGEVIYIPPHWWHATLNLAKFNAFVSTFTQERPRP